MKGRINTCTLEIEGVVLTEKDLKPQADLTRYSSQLLMAMALLVVILNGLALSLLSALSSRFNVQLFLYTLLTDSCGFLFLVLFLKVLPDKRVTFPGMRALAMGLYIVGQVEFNVRMYSNFSDVGGLYVFSSCM
jgi:hypothetical protein